MNKQADGEKTCGTCRNEDTYHCAECENKSDYEQAQEDGEYIRRQAVLDITWEEPSYTDALNVLTEVRDKVKELPSVNPQEPKTGYWIYKTMEGQFCSICDEQSVWKFNYCPNCGARMVDPQERSE